MGLMDRLRKAEEHGKEAARHAMDRAREVRDDAQRRIRQKMRIYPARANGSAPSEVSQANPMAGLPQSDSGSDTAEDVRHLEVMGEGNPDAAQEFRQKVPIISIRGKDLEGVGEGEKKRKTA